MASVQPSRLSTRLARIGYAAANLTLCLVFAAQVQASGLPPLTPAEQEAVIAEIQSMVETNENRVKDFVVGEATPERIERLYQMPEFLDQPKIIRENGLIFAGRGTLLTFDKPSDVVAKMERWFPREFEAARTSKNQMFFGNLDLYGPFPGWDSEPAAFLGLWNCMPHIAWVNPGESPFRRRLSDFSPFRPIAARGVEGEKEFELGFCIKQRSGYVADWTEAELVTYKADRDSTAAKVALVLRDKFARFLTGNQCRGTGPDDCVLVLHLWASLAPTDPALAASLRALEPLAAPDAPLPALQKPAAEYGSGAQEGERRFDESLRQAAFLRAKLSSVLNAPSSWPSDQLPATLRQLTLLKQKLWTAIDYRWSYFELDYYNEEVNPWSVLHANVDKYPGLREAVMAEANSLGSDATCEVLEQWLWKDDPSLQTTYALQQMTSGRPVRCVSPDWAWLKAGASPAAINLRDAYLGLLNGTDSGSLRDSLLTAMTDAGNACFDRKSGPAQDWLRNLCATWITEPQVTPFRLEHSQLTLGEAQQFRVTRLQTPAELEVVDVTAAQEKWLTGLLLGMNVETRRKLQAFAIALPQRNSRIMAATLWHHPQHEIALLDLELRQNEDAKALFLVGPQTFAAVEVPQPFRGDGSELVRVSDLDQDGNLELWWAESFNDCQNDESDLERGVDCTSRTAAMGEIQGGTLSYFIKSTGPRPEQPSGAPLALDPNISSVALRGDEPACNAVLVGSVLAKKLKVDFGGGENQVIELVCRPHPLRPEQTIVALFHALADEQGQPTEDKKGFVYAVVDIRRKHLVAVYRETMDEDAATPIGAANLQIDTARYNLAPGVRALGVRMNLGSDPSCAEGGESDFLTLFVEDGRQLRPVLKNLAMSAWRITQGSNNCGQEGSDVNYTIDSVTLMLEMAATSSAGWRDIDVVAQHNIEVFSEGASAKQEPRKQSLGKLRAEKRSYGTTGLLDKLSP